LIHLQLFASHSVSFSDKSARLFFIKHSDEKFLLQFFLSSFDAIEYRFGMKTEFEFVASVKGSDGIALTEEICNRILAFNKEGDESTAVH
jgi:hypothetical protein